MRHALIDQEEGDWVAALFELLHGAEGAFAGVGPHHAVLGAIATAQVTLHCPEDLRVVIYRE
jgi:hypothetical protein